MNDIKLAPKRKCVREVSSKRDAGMIEKEVDVNWKTHSKVVGKAENKKVLENACDRALVNMHEVLSDEEDIDEDAEKANELPKKDKAHTVTKCGNFLKLDTSSYERIVLKLTDKYRSDKDKRKKDQKKVAERASDVNRSDSLLLRKGNSLKSHDNGMKLWIN